MKKQNNKITENEFNEARESFLSNSLSVEQKQSMLENILNSSSPVASSSPGVTNLNSAKVASDNTESVQVEPIGSMHNVKGKGDNADFKTISLGKTIGVVSFIQPHMLKQKAFIVILILILFLAGTSFASTYSLPGDLLYTVKVRVLEPLVIKTKLSTQAKIQHRIALLDKRIDELNKLDDASVSDENVVKKSFYVTQENIKYLERSAKLIIGENNIKISSKINEYNELLGRRISAAANLKSGLNTISDIFASSTASSTGTSNATSTNSNAQRPGERSDARSRSDSGESVTGESSNLYQRQYTNTGVSASGNATASNPLGERPISDITNRGTEAPIRTIITTPKVGVESNTGTVANDTGEPVEAKAEINHWINSDIFKAN